MTARKATAFDDLLTRIAHLPQLAAVAAPRLAELVEAHMTKTLSAGTDAYGVAWEPKKDGTRALPNAPKALRVTHTPKAIVVKIRGIYARHEWGKVKGGTRRPMLPRKGLPDDLKRAVLQVIREALHDVVSGREVQ